MKQELNHTPGPWRIGDAGATVFGPKTDSPAPKTVAKVSRAPIVSDTDRANACLIAAAPDLLDACNYVDSIAPDAGRTAEGDGGELYTFTITAKALADLRAVIRKARGEA